MAIRSAFARASLLVAVASLACSTTHGRVDFDRAVSFAAYRSFAIVHPPAEGEALPLPASGDIASSQLVERRVRGALERELAAKGLVLAPQESADLLVAFNVGSRRATRSESVPDGGIHIWPHGWWRDHWDLAYTRIVSEGVLIVDLIDAKTRKLVWRGWTTDVLPPSGEIERVVDHAVHEVVENYPPAG